MDCRCPSFHVVFVHCFVLLSFSRCSVWLTSFFPMSCDYWGFAAAKGRPMTWDILLRNPRQGFSETPKRWGHPKRKLIFQPFIFRCYVSFREGMPAICLKLLSQLLKVFFFLIAANPRNKSLKVQATISETETIISCEFPVGQNWIGDTSAWTHETVKTALGKCCFPYILNSGCAIVTCSKGIGNVLRRVFSP